MTDPGNWQTSAKRFAMTVLAVALALYIAVQLIEAVSGVLIVLGAVVFVTYAVVAVHRHRRSRW